MCGWFRAAALCASARNRLQELGVVGQRVVQHLDRDATTQHHVVGEVHGRGRPGADGGQQPVAPSEHLTDTVDHAGDGHHPTLQVAPVQFGHPPRTPSAPPRLPQHGARGHTVGVTDASQPPTAAPTEERPPEAAATPPRRDCAATPGRRGRLHRTCCTRSPRPTPRTSTTGPSSGSIPAPDTKVLQQDDHRHRPGAGLRGHASRSTAPRSPTTSSRSSPSSTRSVHPGCRARTFETLPTGQNCMLASYWQSALGPSPVEHPDVVLHRPVRLVTGGGRSRDPIADERTAQRRARTPRQTTRTIDRADDRADDARRADGDAVAGDAGWRAVHRRTSRRDRRSIDLGPVRRGTIPPPRIALATQPAKTADDRRWRGSARRPQPSARRRSSSASAGSVVVLDEDARHPEGLGGGDVARGVVEEHRPRRRRTPSWSRASS